MRTKFDDAIFIRCPADFSARVAEAANESMTSISDYVRSAVRTQLQRDGYRRTDALCTSSETDKAA
jgi:hypothetical protein